MIKLHKFKHDVPVLVDDEVIGYASREEFPGWKPGKFYNPNSGNAENFSEPIKLTTEPEKSIKCTQHIHDEIVCEVPESEMPGFLKYLMDGGSATCYSNKVRGPEEKPDFKTSPAYAFYIENVGKPGHEKMELTADGFKHYEKYFSGVEEALKSMPGVVSYVTLFDRWLFWKANPALKTEFNKTSIYNYLKRKIAMKGWTRIALKSSEYGDLVSNYKNVITSLIDLENVNASVTSEGIILTEGTVIEPEKSETYDGEYKMVQITIRPGKPISARILEDSVQFVSANHNDIRTAERKPYERSASTKYPFNKSNVFAKLKSQVSKLLPGTALTIEASQVKEWENGYSDVKPALRELQYSYSSVTKLYTLRKQQA